MAEIGSGVSWFDGYIVAHFVWRFLHVPMLLSEIEKSCSSPRSCTHRQHHCHLALITASAHVCSPRTLYYTRALVHTLAVLLCFWILSGMWERVAQASERCWKRPIGVLRSSLPQIQHQQHQCVQCSHPCISRVMQPPPYVRLHSNVSRVAQMPPRRPTP
jgi:hypothetical protein